jgi:repressor LexA
MVAAMASPLPDQRPPTTRQRDILRAIAGSVETRGYPPTIRELCPLLGVTSMNAVLDHLQRLRVKGLLEWSPGSPRTLRLTGAGRAAIAE